MINTKNYYERYWKNELKLDLFPPPSQNNEVIKTRINKIKKYLNGKCLDAGSGDGSVTNILSRITNTTGLELSDTAVEKAKKAFPHIKFIKGSITYMPFKNGEFNCVISSDVIEHVEDTEAMFHEFNRVLKKNGYLILTTPEMTWLKRVFIALFYFDKYFYPNSPHIRFYTRKNLEIILRKFGFRVIQYEYNGKIFFGVPKGMLVVAKKMRQYE